MLRLIVVGVMPCAVIIFALLLAAAVGLVERPLHRAGDPVGIEDHPPLDVAGGAADRLDQRGLGAQEAFLVGVEDRDQAAFGDVEPLAQQVDPDQHVIDAEPQVADQLDPLQRLDVRMHVADPQPRFVEEFGQILGHPLGRAW